MHHFRASLGFAVLLLATPATARDSLGVFSGWGAFRDPATPRCYAIAMAEPSTLAREFQPYADVGTWPRQQTRGQIHFRLSRRMAPASGISLSLGGQRFQLVGGGNDAWAADKRMDAAIVAAMRSAAEMTVSARDSQGRGFSNTWKLAGAATAMDAATIGCARLR
ncbi:MAG: invasion associated locus B family protein [Novosphingobium sp.]